MQPETLPHYWANHFGFLLRKRLVALFAQHGHQITAEEWAILLILQDRDGVTATQLSARTLRDKTTVTRMVDRMVARGFVDRRADTADRRQVRLCLTEAGRAMFARLAPLAQQLIQRSVAGIAVADIDITVSVLARMSENLADPERETTHDL